MDFFHKIMIFIIITITFEVLKFLLSFCVVFPNLLYKNIRFSLLYELPSSELINYYVETVFFPENSSHVKKSRTIYIHSKALS